MNAGELVIGLILKAGNFKKDLAGAQQDLDRTGDAGKAAVQKIAGSLAGLDRSFSVSGKNMAALESVMQSAALSSSSSLQDVISAVEQTASSFDIAFGEISSAAEKAGLSGSASFEEIRKAAEEAGADSAGAFNSIGEVIENLGLSGSATLEEIQTAAKNVQAGAKTAIDEISEAAKNGGLSVKSSLEEIAAQIPGIFRKEFQQAASHGIGEAKRLQDAFEEAVKKGEEIDRVTKAYEETARAMKKAGASKKDLDALADAAKKLGANIGEAKTGFEALLPTLTKIAGFVGVGLSIKSMVSTYLDQADALGKYSDALGLNVEDVQAWEAAVKEAGGSGDEFKSTLQGLSKNLEEAAKTGKGAMAESLGKIGISAKDAAGKAKTALEILPELAGKFEKMSASESEDFAKKLGIDKGTIDLLQKGRKATEEAIKAGREKIKFTKEDAEAAQKANTAIENMQTAFLSLAMRAIAPLIPLITKVANILHSFAQWCSQNKEAVVAFFTAIAIVAGAKAAPAILKLAGNLNKLKVLFGPIGIAVMLLAGIFDELWAFITGGDSIIERFLLKMGVSKETLESVRQVLQSVIGFFLDLWEAITGDGVDAEAAWGRVKATWEAAKEYLAQIVEAIKQKFWDLINGLKNWFSNLFGEIKAWLMNLLPDWVKSLIGGGESADGKKTHDEAAKGNSEAQANYTQLYDANGMPSPGMLAKESAPTTVDNSKEITQTTNISSIVVHTQATDAQGIAADMGSAIRNQTAQIDGAVH